MDKKLIAAVAATIMATACQPPHITIHTIGDSTMADYEENTTRTRGWGEMFCHYVPQNVSVANYARGGRSSRSFYDEGLWQIVKDSLRPDDVVLIQFAHNDEKERGIDGADGRGTAPWTTYRRYLTKYVDEARQLGAKPIFITPIVRRYFSGEQISHRGCHNISATAADTTLNYVMAMQSVADSLGVPMIDMTAKTKQIVEGYGPTESKSQLYVPTDNTHTQARGAALFALATANELAKANFAYMQPCEGSLIVNPMHYDFGTIFLGDEAWYCFDAIDLYGVGVGDTISMGGDGEINISATEPVTLSGTYEGERSSSLTLSKTGVSSFYAHITPRAAGNIATAITVSTPQSTRQITLTACAKEVTKRTPASITFNDICDNGHAVGMSVKEVLLKGLTSTDGGISTDSGEWPADIDEAGNRYIQITLESPESNAAINSISFSADALTCFRVAVACGKDFYPRTTIGEEQAPGTAEQYTYSTKTLLPKGGQMVVRIYPWRREATTEPLTISNIVINGETIE